VIYIPDDNEKNTTDDLETSNDNSETVMTPDENDSDSAAKEPEASVNDSPEEGEDSQEMPAEEGTSEAAPEAQAAGTDDRGRTLYNVKCSNCGKDTQVPFQPSAGRPVYCRDCFMKMKRDS
jgi:CxxC-x17-CxxC domain-containing protein